MQRLLLMFVQTAASRSLAIERQILAYSSFISKRSMKCYDEAAVEKRPADSTDIRQPEMTASAYESDGDD